MTTNPSRVPAGVAAGGQFAAGARAESEVQLDEPVLASAQRPSPETWQHPADADRAVAITSYDDSAGWAVIGEGLRVQQPLMADRFWVDSARRTLGQLHRAGLHGQARASSHGHPDSNGWSLDVELPSGQRLTVRSDSEHDSLGERAPWISVAGSGTSACHYVEAPGRWKDFDQADLNRAVDATLRAVHVADTWRRQVSAAGLLGFDARGTSEVAPDGDGFRLRVSSQRGDTLIDMVDGSARITHLQGKNGWAPVEHDEELARFASRIGLRGGRRAGTHHRAQEMLDAAASTELGPDEVAVRAHRGALASGVVPHIYPS